MPDILDANGLTVKNASEITSDLVTGMQAIYGSSINVDQNSPDGQMIGLLTQMAVDIRELAVAVNNGFDPDQALGVILDQRVTINNIARAGGTYTVQPIDIVVSGTVTLQGLDADYNNPNGTGYTVQDSSGNKFILAATAVLTAGTTTVNFRAQLIGAVDVPVDTITDPVTVVLGVTSVNNGSAAVTVGETQETDTQLRTRRAQSVALASTGYLNGLLGAILNLPGVTEAALYENYGSTTDVNGIPPHCIWLVVSGGSTEDIANTMYARKSYGCDMKGEITFEITTPSNSIFVAAFDNPTPENLYVRFSIQQTVIDFSFDTDSISDYIAENVAYTIGSYAETSSLTAAAILAIAAQGGGGVPVLMQISDDGINWTDYLPAPTLASEWTLDPSRIAISVLT